VRLPIPQCGRIETSLRPSWDGARRLMVFRNSTFRGGGCLRRAPSCTYEGRRDADLHLVIYSNCIRANNPPLFFTTAFPLYLFRFSLFSAIFLHREFKTQNHHANASPTKPKKQRGSQQPGELGGVYRHNSLYPEPAPIPVSTDHPLPRSPRAQVRSGLEAVSLKSSQKPGALCQ
jgi:hypothetical protein